MQTPTTSTAEAITRAIRVQLARQQRSALALAGDLDRAPSWLSGRMRGHTPYTTNDIDLIAKALGMSGLSLLRLAHEEEAA